MEMKTNFCIIKVTNAVTQIFIRWGATLPYTTSYMMHVSVTSYLSFSVLIHKETFKHIFLSIFAVQWNAEQ